MQKEEKKKLRIFSKQIQMKTIETIAGIGIGHVGGALSIADLLAVLYGKQMKIDPKHPAWEERDWLVVSKGHAGPAVYSALALKGYFPMEQLDTLNRCGTRLPSHCDRNLTTGIDITTGSLGQGASSAMVIACGNRLKGYDNYTYLIIGDGEAEEGQVWEAAIFAHAKKFTKVIAFVDYTKCQIDDYVENLCAMGDIAAKFESFGWYAQNVENGNDVEQILTAVNHAKAQDERPSAIILNTVKGKGYSKIEGSLGSHNMPVSAEMVEEALTELCLQEKVMEE